MTTDSLIHIYHTPPKVGDTALCGHIREDEMEGHRLHTPENQCLVCKDIAETSGMTLLQRTPLDPEGQWRRSP